MFENGLAYLKRGFFTESWGSFLDWGLLVTLLLAVLILLGIFVPLILYRGRQPDAGPVWVVYVLALGVLPTFLWPFSTFTIFEYTAQNQFCGSCHSAMDPYIEDLQKPNGKSLASLHYQNRIVPDGECFACHANYGVHGTVVAKLSGLHDAYAYVTGSYARPIKLPSPFPNAECLKCHEGAKIFSTVQFHLDDDGKGVSKDILSGATRCQECHPPGHELASH